MAHIPSRKEPSMSFCFQKLAPPNQMWLTIIFVILLAWFGFFAWAMAWPLTWGSLPIWLCFGYMVFRIFFELTANRANVPTLATCFVARQKIARILARDASLPDKKVYTVVDLGSGRGELARCIAKKIPHATVMGIEMASFPYRQAAFLQRWLGPKNLSFQRCDFWSFDCSQADAIVLYLAPVTAQRMGEKLAREMKQGSMVISHTFPLLGEWIPLDVLSFCSPFKETFYVYRKQ